MKFEEQEQFAREIAKYTSSKDISGDLYIDLQDMAFGNDHLMEDFIKLRKDTFWEWLEQKGRDLNHAQRYELMFLEQYLDDFLDFALGYFHKHGVS